MVIKDPNLAAPQSDMQPRATSSITDFIVHHTDGPADQSVAAIDLEHRAIGDAMIAYNWVITKDGTVWSGRPVDYVPAAAYGRNAQSVDVVLTGQFQPDAANYTGPPTAAQMASLEALCVYAHRTFPSIVRTIGHRDVAPMFYNGDGNYATACPGDDCYKLLPAMVKRVAAALVAGK